MAIWWLWWFQQITHIARDDHDRRNKLKKKLFNILSVWSAKKDFIIGQFTSLYSTGLAYLHLIFSFNYIESYLYLQNFSHNMENISVICFQGLKLVFIQNCVLRAHRGYIHIFETKPLTCSSDRFWQVAYRAVNQNRTELFFQSVFDAHKKKLF